MARPSKFRSDEKLRIVLSVLRGEAGVAETPRREKVPIGQLFRQGGR
jgi:hypothetical protein